MTPQEVLEFAKKNDAKQLDLRFTDIPSLQHHVSYPVSELEIDSFEEGFGMDGSSIRGWAAIHESDMLLIPDPNTAFMDPFAETPTLVMYGDVKDPITKQRYERDPRCQRAGIVHQRARQQHAPRFSRRHFRDGPFGQVRNLEQRQDRGCLALDLRRDAMVGLHADAAEEAGFDRLAPGDLTRAQRHPVVGDHSQQRAEIEDIPALLAEDRHARSLAYQRIAFPHDGFDQRGFAAA